MNREFILNTKLTETQVALFYLGQEGFLFKHYLPFLLLTKNCTRMKTVIIWN